MLALVFAMVQLISAGRGYPEPTTTLLFQWLHPFDPMTCTVTELCRLIVGGIEYRRRVVIGGPTVAFLAVSTWAARRNRE